MKKYTTLLLFSITCLSNIPLKGMEINDCKMDIDVRQSPMDYKWFYSKKNIFINANKFHEYQCWKNAIDSYEAIICNLYNLQAVNKTILYHLNMALLNTAACLMAQRQATKYWSAFDDLLNIQESRQISNEIIKNAKKNAEKRVLVRTDLISIGDIFCFLPAINTLEKRTKWNIILEVPKFLIITLETAAKTYNFNIYSPQIIHPTPDYETHLVSLLGHLKLTPAHMIPEKVIFTASEKAINTIENLIKETLAQNNYIAVIDRGEVGQQTTVIGGRQLSNRHLDAEPFKQLLNKHSNLTLFDCSKTIDRVVVDEKQNNRYLRIPKGTTSLDTIIALGHIMNKTSTMIAFIPEMEQTNVFIRSLNHEAQNRVTLIIPCAKEHDVRMSGPDQRFVYKHMFSNCWIYKCNTRDEQTQAIEEAYQNIIGNK